MNTNVIKEFFTGDVIPNKGFILSADTLNPKHLGPKMMSFARALAPEMFTEWLNTWGDNFAWGDDAERDGDAYQHLYDILESVTSWAREYIPAMFTQTEIYEFGFSDYDGALLGWWCYDTYQ